MARNTLDRGGLVYSFFQALVTGAITGDEFGTFVNLIGELPINLTWHIIVNPAGAGGTGSYTSFTILLEGSLDGVKWETLDSTTNAAGEMRHVANKKVRFVRANVSAAAVASGNPKISVGIAA